VLQGRARQGGSGHPARLLKVAAFDIGAALRWSRFDPGRTLQRRADGELPSASAEELAGQPLLLATCVYIDQLQGRAPSLVEGLIDKRQVNHSTVAIQELSHTIGVLDPADKRTPNVITVIRDQIEAMPEHRTFAPDADVLGRAALLSGTPSKRLKKPDAILSSMPWASQSSMSRERA